MTISSPPSRGAWIESPASKVSRASRVSSPPSRGAWIESSLYVRLITAITRRPPHGGRGLKEWACMLVFLADRRPPHGGRGLKARPRRGPERRTLSPPSRGAWIERVHRGSAPPGFPSPPSRGAWIERETPLPYPHKSRGRPPHGGRGLKVRKKWPGGPRKSVAPLTGGVD